MKRATTCGSFAYCATIVLTATDRFFVPICCSAV
jgi:hypothetical protein